MELASLLKVTFGLVLLVSQSLTQQALHRLVVGLTAYAAAQKAPSHFDGLGAEVDLWVMLVQPGDPEYHALLAEAGDCK